MTGVLLCGLDKMPSLALQAKRQEQLGANVRAARDTGSRPAWLINGQGALGLNESLLSAPCLSTGTLDLQIWSAMAGLMWDLGVQSEVLTHVWQTLY